MEKPKPGWMRIVVLLAIPAVFLGLFPSREWLSWFSVSFVLIATFALLLFVVSKFRLPGRLALVLAAVPICLAAVYFVFSFLALSASPHGYIFATQAVAASGALLLLAKHRQSAAQKDSERTRWRVHKTHIGLAMTMLASCVGIWSLFIFYTVLHESQKMTESRRFCIYGDQHFQPVSSLAALRGSMFHGTFEGLDYNYFHGLLIIEEADTHKYLYNWSYKQGGWNRFTGAKPVPPRAFKNCPVQAEFLKKLPYF